MGRNRLLGSANGVLPVAETVDGIAAGWNASHDTAPLFFGACRNGQGCLTCASQLSRGENSGALALLGLARSVTGNARLRGMRDTSMAQSRADAHAKRSR
jgi:hypothetical protein